MLVQELESWHANVHQFNSSGLDYNDSHTINTRYIGVANRRVVDPRVLCYEVLRIFEVGHTRHGGNRKRSG